MPLSVFFLPWCVSIIMGLVTCGSLFIIKHELLRSRVGVLLTWVGLTVWWELFYDDWQGVGSEAGTLSDATLWRSFLWSHSDFPDKTHNSHLEERGPGHQEIMFRHVWVQWIHWSSLPNTGFQSSPPFAVTLIEMANSHLLSGTNLIALHC